VTLTASLIHPILGLVSEFDPPPQSVLNAGAVGKPVGSVENRPHPGADLWKNTSRGVYGYFAPILLSVPVTEAPYEQVKKHLSEKFHTPMDLEKLYLF
jgi:hypothetical protein